ncbi:MAG: hypothetical protein ACOX3G_04295 [Armatimonadota bacterium]
MKCVKCGADLRSEQKVCIVCGTRTAAGGHFHVETKEAWKPSARVKYAAAGVGVLLVILLLCHIFRTIPPKIIATEWFDAMAQRSCGKAAGYHTDAFNSRMQPGVSDTHAMSEYFFDEIHNNEATYTVGEAAYPSAGHATVIVTLKYPDQRERQIPINLVKMGRRWLIDSVYN